jgi:hypothetical protein
MDINNTGGFFATGTSGVVDTDVKNTGGKVSAGINDLGETDS